MYSLRIIITTPEDDEEIFDSSSDAHDWCVEQEAAVRERLEALGDLRQQLASEITLVKYGNVNTPLNAEDQEHNAFSR